MPFVLHRGDQFRPPPPPALDSPGYAAALTETQHVGAKASPDRTAAHTEDATFWAAPIQNYWNAIADQVATAQHTDLDGTAHLLAQLDTTLADATIALYDAKYTYQLWRPITAIRQADSDHNDGTTPDTTWEPLASTPADPSYPGAHSDLSFAAATVLADRYGDSTPFTVTSPTLPGVAAHLRPIQRRRHRGRAQPHLRRRAHPHRPRRRPRTRHPGRRLRPQPRPPPRVLTPRPGTPVRAHQASRRPTSTPSRRIRGPPHRAARALRDEPPRLAHALRGKPFRDPSHSVPHPQHSPRAPETHHPSTTEVSS